MIHMSYHCLNICHADMQVLANMTCMNSLHGDLNVGKLVRAAIKLENIKNIESWKVTNINILTLNRVFI